MVRVAWFFGFRARLLLVDDLDARLARHDDGVGHVEEEAVLHHAHHLGDLVWLFVGVGVVFVGCWFWGHGCVCGNDRRGGVRGVVTQRQLFAYRKSAFLNHSNRQRRDEQDQAGRHLLGGLGGVLDGLLEVEVHDVVIVVRHVRLPALHPQLSRAGALMRVFGVMSGGGVWGVIHLVWFGFGGGMFFRVHPQLARAGTLGCGFGLGISVGVGLMRAMWFVGLGFGLVGGSGWWWWCG